MNESKLPQVGSFIFIGAFAYLAVFLMKNAIPLNIATWVLWTVLDVFIAYSMFKTKNPGRWMMVALATGAGLIALISIAQLAMGKTQWSWSYKETITLICFVVALVFSRITQSQKAAVNAGTTAMFIAGLPTLVDAWYKPDQQNPWFWGICTLGCFVTFLGSPRGFTAQYLPIGGMILNGLITALAMRSGN